MNVKCKVSCERTKAKGEVIYGEGVRLADTTIFYAPLCQGRDFWIATLGSSVLDNVVLVAALIPVIQNFASMSIDIDPLWWALLFGGCLGGNITLVGSTANIVALGILEKEKNLKIKFFHWLGIGLVVGIVTTGIVWLFLSIVG